MPRIVEFPRARVRAKLRPDVAHGLDQALKELPKIAEHAPDAALFLTDIIREWLTPRPAAAPPPTIPTRLRLVRRPRQPLRAQLRSRDDIRNANRLRRARLKAHLSQVQLAVRASVSWSTVSRLETGRQTIRRTAFQRVMRLARALGQPALTLWPVRIPLRRRREK